MEEVEGSRGSYWSVTRSELSLMRRGCWWGEEDPSFPHLPDSPLMIPRDFMRSLILSHTGGN